MDSSRLDDEHKLIARYAQRLAQEARTMVSHLTFTYIFMLTTQSRVVICFTLKREYSYYLNPLNFQKSISESQLNYSTVSIIVATLWH